MKKNETATFTKAFAALSGNVVPVNTEELPEIVGKILFMLSKDCSDENVKDIISNADKYNKDNITFITVNATKFGTMITFVKEQVTDREQLATDGGVMCYVYNADYPDCSELGYCSFDYKDRVLRRIG